MRLTVFARGLGSQPTGRGLVASHLIDALRILKPDWSMLLLSPADPGIAGVEWIEGKGSSFIGDVSLYLRGAAATIERRRPDVLWAASHVVPVGLDLALPKIVTLHDVVWRDYPRTMRLQNRIISSLGARSLQAADRILCNSHFTFGRLAHYWPWLADQASVMPLAPSPRFRRELDPSPTLETLGVRAPFVLNVDTFEPRKNLGVYLDCASALPEVTFVHCGGVGWGVGSALREAKRLPNLRLLGYVDETELNALYRSAACAVFPSLYEGFHISPLDAANLGCPVIASDIPAHREVLGDAAKYAEPADASGFWRHIQDVLSDPEESARLRTAGKTQAETFSWSRSAKILAGAIEGLKV